MYASHLYGGREDEVPGRGRGLPLWGFGARRKGRKEGSWALHTEEEEEGGEGEEAAKAGQRRGQGAWRGNQAATFPQPTLAAHYMPDPGKQTETDSSSSSMSVPRTPASCPLHLIWSTCCACPFPKTCTDMGEALSLC